MDSVRIPAYEGPFGDNESSYQEGMFLSRIQQDEGLRERLAVHMSTNGLYGHLDWGDSFDYSLDTSLHLAIGNAKLLDKIASSGDFSTAMSEEGWQKVLEAMEAGEREDFEPGKVRKGLAALILRQEVSTKRYVISLSPWRKRSPTASSGTM